MRHTSEAAAADRPKRSDVVAATVEIRCKSFDGRAAVTNRKNMQYHMIVGLTSSEGLASPSALAGRRASTRAGLPSSRRR
jgi:hypothetical protein